MFTFSPGKRSKTNTDGDPANKHTKKPKIGEVNVAPNSVKSYLIITKQDSLFIKHKMQEADYDDDLDLNLEKTYALRKGLV